MNISSTILKDVVGLYVAYPPCNGEYTFYNSEGGGFIFEHKLRVIVCITIDNKCIGVSLLSSVFGCIKYAEHLSIVIQKPSC